MFTLTLIVLGVVGLIVWVTRTQETQIPRDPPVIVVGSQGLGNQGDARYSRAPEAERDYRPAFFNVATQGIPESYQSMGLVKTGDGKLLPLYGRRSISSRDRYNYYTRTDTYNPVPMPITIKGRDCQDQVGCPELYDGDKVKLSATDQTGEVTIYRVRDIVR